MINRSRLFFISGWLLLLAGCASVPGQLPATSIPGAIPQESVPPAAISQQAPGAVEQIPKTTMSGNPAVIALLDRAQIDTDTGHREAAGASLERGLRIEPHNAWLWHELAQLRLIQGQYAQAIALAQKSISFAARDRSLLALDWRVIGNARVAQGNYAGAEEAFKQAADLEQAVKAAADHGF